jgi:carboxyl-terminal processing protease
MTRTERERCFVRIQQLVRDKYYDPQFRGKDWDAISKQHQSAIVGAETLESFEAEANAMLKELGSSALGLLRETSKISSRSAISASFRRIETKSDGPRWVFQDVAPGGPADCAGIKPGDTLIRIGTEDSIPPTRPVFVMGAQVEILIRHGRTGQTDTITITLPKAKHRDNPTAEPRAVVSSMTEGIGILKVSLFPGKLGIDFARQVSTAVETDLKGAEALIIDLRGNPGGGVGGLRLMSFLTPERVPIGYSLDRKLAEAGYDRESLPRFNRIPSSRWELPLLALRYARKKSVVLETEGLGGQRFHGRTSILVNEHTTCAAEMVALFAQERGFARILGMPTPGRLVSHTGVALGHGFTLTIPTGAYVSWMGSRLDGRGIRPDIEVDWSYSAILASHDAQLELAKEALANRLSSKTTSLAPDNAFARPSDLT